MNNFKEFWEMKIQYRIAQMLCKILGHKAEVMYVDTYEGSEAYHICGRCGTEHA